MNEYNALKDAIRAAIKPNGEYALTAQVLQNILIAIVNSFGKGYQFMGIATADTEPGEPDEKEFYVGFAGEYANFVSETVTVPVGGVVIFLYDTEWHANVVKVAERVAVSGNHLEIDGARSIIEQDIVNVNTLTSQDEAFLTAAAARAAVSAESGLRIGGQVITYLVETDEEHHTAWVVDQFTGDDAEGWENDDNWQPFLYVELAKIVSNQAQINEAIMEALGNRYTKEQIDGMIEPLSERMGAAEEGLAAEILRAQAAESRLQDIYEGLTQNPVIVGPLPSSGQADTIYRVPGTSSYSDYMWNGTQFVLMATYSDGRLDFINVNLLNATGSTPHAAYATADAARADISAASGLRALGLQITYLLTDGVWYTDQYIGTDISGWSTPSNWQALGPVRVTQNSQTGHTDINIGSDSYPVASVEEVSQLGQEVSENCIVNAKRISFSEQGYVPYTIKNGDKLIVRVIKSPGSSTNLYANPSQSGTGQVQVCTLEASNATYIYEAGMDSSYLRFTGANMSNGAIVEVIRANGLWEDVYELINIARYQSPSYPCFVAIGSDHKDVGGVTVNINDGVNPVYSVKVYSSVYYNAFLYLKLKGFDTTKTWVLGIFRNKMQGSEYKIYFYPLVNGSRDTSNAISFTITSQIANPAGINVISCNSDSGNCRLDAIIDLSQIPATSQSQVLLSSYGDVFKVSPECFKHYADETEFKALQADVVALQANSLTDSDLTIDVLSNNIADPAGILLKTITSSSGNIQSNNDWDTYKLPVTPGNKYTIGGFSLGRTGFYAFYNGDTKLDYGNVSDPSGSAGPTLTAPANATWLYFDIKSGSSPSNPYQYLQINEGDTFLAYDAFEKGVTKINNINIAGVGGGGGSLSPEAFATLIQDLPTSADGSDVAVGYAYIDSSTGVVTVKLS